MVALRNLPFAVLLALAAPAAAQPGPWLPAPSPPEVSTITLPAPPTSMLGQALSVSGGPWALGEV
ncbi:MAG: hypothetical protein AAB262_00230, partial [Elusimicrobiota bacterium]